MNTQRIRVVVIAVSLLLLIASGMMIVNQAKAFPGDQPALVVEPSSIQNTSLTPGSMFSVNITLYNVTLSNTPDGLGAIEVHLFWNTSILAAVSFVSYVGSAGGVFSGSGPFLTAIPAGFEDITNTTIPSPPYTSAASYAVAMAAEGSPWYGDGLVATLTFQVLANGSSPLTLAYPTSMADYSSNAISFYNQNGFFSNIAPPPSLSALVSPLSTSIPLGQNVNFTSTVTGGVPPYTYQWYKNGTIVAGANSTGWDFVPLATGTYDVYLNVTDHVGTSADSSNAIVSVTPPAALTASIMASSTTVFVGQTVNFNSTVSGGLPPYAFQWCLNGSTIPSATLSTYMFTPNASGLYLFSMNVTDSAPTTSQSNTVSITVMPALTGPVLYIDPSQILNVSLGPGSVFSINITVANVTNLGRCMFNVTYDPAVLSWIGFNLIETQGQYPTFWLNGSSVAGYAWISLIFANPVTVQSAPLTALNFVVNSYGITPLNLTNTQLLDNLGNPIVHNTFGGIFANIIRDVAVTNVVPAVSWLYQNWTDPINVTVANFGNVTENFTASAWYDGTLIGSVPVINLAPNTQSIVPFLWNTSGIPQGNYTITGTASFVPYETYFNTTNNVYVDGTVQVLTTIQDVAVLSVLPTLAWVYAGQIVPVNVTVANDGMVVESFNVTAYYNGTAIDTIPVIGLGAGASQVLTFNWNTSGISVEGNYILSAFASYVPFEYNMANNYLTGGQVLVLTLIRDVAITTVQSYETYFGTEFAPIISPIYHVPMVEMFANRILTVNVTAANLGNVTETFSVSALIDGNTTLGTLLVSNLAPLSSTVLTFHWSPIAMKPSSTALHTVSANASLVPYEYNTTNNFLNSSVKVMIKQFGDVNGDGIINLSDMTLLGKSYNTGMGQPNFNPEADFNNDGFVNLVDLTTLSKYYNTSY
jgi:hypothetical protein